MYVEWWPLNLKVISYYWNIYARMRSEFWNLYFHIFHFQYSLSPKIPFSISTNTLPKYRHCLKGNYQLVLDVSVFCWMHLCVVFTATQTTSAMLCFPRANLVFLQPTKYLHLAPSNIHNVYKLLTQSCKQEQRWGSYGDKYGNKRNIYF